MQIIQERIQQSLEHWRHPSWWNLLIALPWAILAGVSIYDWTADRDVAKREQTAEGIIISHQPENHNRYGYTFSYNGKSYSGFDNSRKQEPHIGQRVTVYYDPSHPSTNALTDFDDLASTSLGPVPLVMFGIGVLAFLI